MERARHLAAIRWSDRRSAIRVADNRVTSGRKSRNETGNRVLLFYACRSTKPLKALVYPRHLPRKNSRLYNAGEGNRSVITASWSDSFLLIIVCGIRSSWILNYFEHGSSKYVKSRVSFLAFYSFNTVNKMLLLFSSITRSWDQFKVSSLPSVPFLECFSHQTSKQSAKKFAIVVLNSSLDKKCRKGLKTRGRRSRWNELKARLARSTGGNGPAYGVIIFSTGRKGRWEARVLSHTLSLSFQR